MSLSKLSLFLGLSVVLIACVVAWVPPAVSSQASTKKVAKVQTVALELELSADGQAPRYANIIVPLGQTATITQGAWSIQVLPTQKSRRIVDLSFVLSKQKQDKSIVVSRPHIRTLLGRSASITVQGKQHLALSVVAQHPAHPDR